MRARAHIATAGLLTFAFAAPPDAQATISDGRTTVTVNDLGVLVAVPAAGLVTYDGPQVRVSPGTAEWSGVSYDGLGGHVEAVAAGNRRDWAERELVEALAFQSGDSWATSLTAAADLEIRTDFTFDPDGPCLLVNVTLTNVGSDLIGNLFYTREWSARDGGWSFPNDTPPPLPVAPGVRRMSWMFDNLLPGQSTAAGFSYMPSGDVSGSLESTAGVDVPLSLWTSASWPQGVIIGDTNGISFGDFDADGFTDMFALDGGNLFRNAGGEEWELVTNLAALLPFAAFRYGSSFGDYDNDGLPDIGCEPRFTGGDSCHHLFHNLGNHTFVDVATDPVIMDVQACFSDSETICWGDTDGDGNLDMFLPVYPPSLGSEGNFFWHNQGPVGPGGAYTFEEKVVAAGLDNPPGAARPEGAQFVDTDFDGDFELYSNGTLYRNVSTPGTPSFDAMTTTGSGIEFSSDLEEGIVFHDADMDGDFDFTGVWSSGAIGVRIHEARGDGTYALLPANVVASHTTGLNLGISTEDWDNDGDMDFTTRQVFRRNMFAETGTLGFVVASTTIPASHLTSATPAWADWDFDGDLDCALGNWLSVGHFYENTLYDGATPDSARRYVRVRVLRDSAAVPAGLETEYGAIVSVHVAGEDDNIRRKKFVSSSGGYLNQNEYTLHFALPDDPAPGDPSVDLVLDVEVDLAGPPEDGFLRIDKHVNPVLGGVQLAELVDREIVVFRSGVVELDGDTFDPSPATPIEYRTTTDGLVRAHPTTAISRPTAAPGADHYVGIELDTLGAAAPVRMVEILVDGQLDTPQTCPVGDTNITLWDVTAPGSPTVVSNAAFDHTTLSRNDRSYYRSNVLLDPGRVFRLVARVTELRGTAVTAPVVNGVVQVNGGLSFTDASPCLGLGVEAAAVDPTRVYLAARFNEDAGAPFVDVSPGTPGVSGVPVLTGSGPATSGSPATLDVTGAAPNAPALLVVGLSPDGLRVLGGTLVPALDLVIAGLSTDASGELSVSDSWPASLAAGESLYIQAAIADASAVGGASLSNAIAGSTQP